MTRDTMMGTKVIIRDDAAVSTQLPSLALPVSLWSLGTRKEICGGEMGGRLGAVKRRELQDKELVTKSIFPVNKTE